MASNTALIQTDEVRIALQAGAPIVALESTLISHGLPWPANLETALEAESAVRAAGAVLATIAVIAGEIRVGLTQAELEQLRALGGDRVLAANRTLIVCNARVAAEIAVAYRSPGS